VLLVHVLLHRDRRLTRQLPELPELPLLAPWYRVAEDEGRIVFEHADRAVLLEGAAVRQLLPRLLPLLDGTRTVADIVAVVGVPAERAVVKALALLAERGLLAAGPGAGGPAELRATAEELASGGAAAPAVAARRIRSACVAVAGDSRVAVETARLLAGSGVRSVRRRALDEPADGDDLLVAAPSAGEFRALRTCNELALAAGSAWLQALPFDGRMAAVGPLFLPGETACHVCYLLRRSASRGFGELEQLLEAEPICAPAGPALELFVAAVAATLALQWLALLDQRLPGVLHAIEPDGGPRVTRHLVLRVPRCPACSSTYRLAPPAPWFDPATEAAA
jgi:bacteriocin biosynthesis cyclodehydratase domain-containing protein